MAKIKFSELNITKNKRPKAGDIFAIELTVRGEHPYKPDKKNFKNPTHDYAFGRIIQVDHVKDVLIEIFNYCGVFPEEIGEVVIGKTMFPPVNVTGLCFSKDRWKIIASTSLYDKEISGFSSIELVMGIPPLLKVWRGGTISPITEKAAKGLERYVSYFPIDIESRIESINRKLRHS